MSDQEMLADLPHAPQKGDAPPKHQPPIGGRGDVSWKRYSNQWKENHGTPLMVFASVIFAIGSGVIYFQQNRFRPVGFPSADAIQNNAEAVSSVSSGEQDLTTSDASLDEEKIASSTIGEPIARSPEVVVEVTGAVGSKGRIRIAVYRSTENFNNPDQADWKGDFAVQAKGSTQCSILLPNSTDRFAVAAYHDENDNGQLDRNGIGIPTEKYGFSNDARGKLGPPSFDDAVMSRPENDQPIELKIR